MKPFLRATDRARLAPVGWVAEPAGMWAGRQVEVVFDPRQHQIVMVRNEPGETTRAALAGEGFRRLAVDGQQEMWMRDRSAAVDQARTPATAIQTSPKVASHGGRGL
jgi:hypothetical protein